MRRFLLFFFILCCGAGVAFFAGTGCEREEKRSPFTIDPHFGKFVITTQGRGFLEPAAEMVATVPPQLWGSLEYVVEEGAVVKPGDVLFKVSTQRLERAARRFWLQAGRQRVNYEKNKVKNEQASASRTEELTAATVRLTHAQHKEKFLARSADPLAIEKARLELASATRSIEYLSSRLQTRRSLADKGYASRLELLQTEDQFDQAILRKTKAETTLTRYRLGKTKKERERLRRTTNRLSINREELVDRNRRQLKIDTLSEERERLNVESSEAAAKQRTQIMKRATVTATTTGTAIYLDLQHMGLGRIRKGMSVWQGLRLLKVAELSALRAVLQVAASDIERVKVGQEAIVSFPALPGFTSTGKVTKVGKVAIENTWGGKNEAKKFEVWVQLEKTHPLLRPNLSAKAIIKGNEIDNAIRLPAQSVRREGTKYSVSLATATGWQRKEVEIAAFDGEFYYSQSPFLKGASIALCEEGDQ